CLKNVRILPIIDFVTLRMEMEKLRLRCPSCAKLYEVSDADIKSHTPQFDCVSCATRFGFQYPVMNFQLIETFVVSANPEMQEARSFQQELEAQSFAALQLE